MATQDASIRQNTTYRLNSVSVNSLKAANSRLPSFSRQDSDKAESVDKDIPFTIRQPSFYHWFKNKLWCIRRSASIESASECYGPKTSNNVVIKRPKEYVNTGRFQKVKRHSNVATEVLNERQSTLMSKNTLPAKKVFLTDQLPQKADTDLERQVTFNDIVKTHIKVKYVTADEMRQLKSMNTHHVMYQLIALKNEELSVNRTTPDAGRRAMVRILKVRDTEENLRQHLSKIATFDVFSKGIPNNVTWPKTSTDKKPVYQFIVGRLFDILRVLGRAPFYRNEEGTMQFKYVSIIALYSLTTYLTIVYLSFLYLRDGIFLFGEVDFNKKMELLFAMSLITSQMIAPIDSWFHIRSTQRYLNLWNEFQTQYEEVTMQTFPQISLLRPSYRVMIVCGTVGMIVFVVLLPHCLTHILPWPHLPVFILSALGNAMHFGIWLITAHVIRKVSKKFYQHFLEEISKSEGYTPKVEQYRLLWMQLSRLVRDCGSSNGICVTIFILQTTFSLVLFIHMAIFNISEHLDTHTYYRIPIDIILACFWYRVLKSYCEAGHKMTESCTNYSLENILRLKKYNSLQEELYLNILFFTLKNYRAKATVSNYYVVNRALFGSVRIIGIPILRCVLYYSRKCSIKHWKSDV